LNEVSEINEKLLRYDRNESSLTSLMTDYQALRKDVCKYVEEGISALSIVKGKSIDSDKIHTLLKLQIELQVLLKYEKLLINYKKEYKFEKIEMLYSLAQLT
jgi:hypothetical protein